MTTRITPLVSSLLADFLVAVDRLAGRPEVDHQIEHWSDRHHRLLTETARMDPQTVFDAINSALVTRGCWTEDAVRRADEARYHQAHGLSLMATSMLHTAAWLAAEELVGMVRPRWLDLDPVLDMVADNLRAATALTMQETST